jgi:hypothetical protein
MISEKDIKDFPLNQGLKFDQDKPRMDLLDAKALEGLARVLTFGAHKYAAHNWRTGLHYSRVISALLRHLNAVQQGQDIDPESNLPHIDHIGCCWMFLSNYMKGDLATTLDDRWKEPQTLAAKYNPNRFGNSVKAEQLVNPLGCENFNLKMYERRQNDSKP